MTLKVSYNNTFKDFYEKLEDLLIGYPLVKLEGFNEDVYSQRKNCFKLRGIFGTRMPLFAALYDKDNKIITAFYSENNSCTIDYITDVLNHWVLYNPIEDDRRSRTEETASSSD